MPELPEVHTTATILNNLVKGLIIRDIWSGYDSPFHKGKSNIKNTEYFEGFRKNVTGRKILSVTRRAKNVLINLSGNETILIHMKMTGHLLYGTYKRNTAKKETTTKQSPNSKIQNKKGWEREVWIPDEKESRALKDPFNRFIRLVFILSNKKQLVLSDMRKFAKVCLLKTKTIEESEDLKGLGPEPLEPAFTLPQCKSRLLLRPNAPIKQALMDQSLIAGIGNIYSDEMLWLSGIHPLSPVSHIPEKKLGELFKAMIVVLKKGINFQGDSTSDYRNPYGEAGAFQHKHHAYRKTGKPCLKNDGGTITRKIIGGRSAHFCPVHQKLF